eukprot:scaffold145925_cov18-Prasinocladus_malaysianus.AAC.1
MIPPGMTATMGRTEQHSRPNAETPRLQMSDECLVEYFTDYMSCRPVSPPIIITPRYDGSRVTSSTARKALPFILLGEAVDE